MAVVLGIVMFAALIGMIVCNKKQNVVPVAKPMAMVLMIVVIVCAIFLMKEMNVFGDSQESAIKRETTFYISQAYVAGDFIKSNHEVGKVLIVADPSFKNDTRMGEFEKALKAGMGGGDVAIDTVEVPGANAEMAEPISELMRAKDFDAVVAKHPDAKVVITLIGLPRDAGNLKALKDARDKKGPALMIVGYSETPGLANAIKAGAISAFITASPTAVYNEDRPPRDPKEAFKVRFVLVNKDNVAENAAVVGN